MKPGFRERLINDPFGDPCLYVRFVHEKGALLFDIGDIRALTPAELHKVTDVFVTHTHIDHFIGFDVLLRIILRRDIPLNIYGPHGIIGNIQGKLHGYTWNLIEDYPTEINVFGFDGKSLRHVRFRAAMKFRKETISSTSSEGLLIDRPGFSVRAIRMDHGTACLAYSLEEKKQISIDKDRLLKKGLAVGPWLSEFRNRLMQGSTEGTISAGGKRRKVSNLMDIARINRGQKLSYATDIAMTKKNIARLISFVSGADIFYCEGYFSERDRQRAMDRQHLTAGKAGIIAGMAGIERLVLMHFSPKYNDAAHLLINEAEEAFGKKVLCGPFRR